MRTGLITLCVTSTVLVTQIAAAQGEKGSPGAERAARDPGAISGFAGAAAGESPGVDRSGRAQWLTPVDTAFFGRVSRVLLPQLFETRQPSFFEFSPFASADFPEAMWVVALYRPPGLGSWLRLDVEPRYGLVYVDGLYAGLVENFDSPFRRLRLPLGRHLVEIRAPGYDPLVLDVWQQHDVQGTYRARLTPRP